MINLVDEELDSFVLHILILNKHMFSPSLPTKKIRLSKADVSLKTVIENEWPCLFLQLAQVQLMGIVEQLAPSNGILIIVFAVDAKEGNESFCQRQSVRSKVR
jgi:hypothetical protein